MNQQYQTLNNGDIRKRGDEVRKRAMSDSANSNGSDHEGKPIPVMRGNPAGQWEPVQLIGLPILHSDNFIAEFRRPV